MARGATGATGASGAGGAGGAAGERVQVGVVGVGNYASSYHVPHLLANPAARIQAICDASVERLAAAGAATGVAPARRYADHRQMLDAEPLDAVTVSSPHALHAEHVRAALERGLHVLVDKPFVLRSADARALIHLAEERGCVLLVALNRHLDPANLYARDLIRSAALGQPVFARSLQVGYPLGGFYADPELSGGGPLVGRGTHMASLMPWLTGWRPVSVTAVLAAGGGEVDDGAALSIAFAGGALGQIAAVRHGSPPVDEMEVHCSEGSVVVERVRGRRGWVVRRDGAEPDPDDLLPAGQTTTDHFIDAVLGRTPPRVPLVDALLSVQILEAAYESARTGCAVSIAYAEEGDAVA